MVPTFQLTARALNDLDEIWSYIARDSVNSANRVESAILSACARLAHRPLLGSRRADITALPVRFWSVTRFPNYIVVYRQDIQPLRVIAVLHGMRDIKALIEEPEVV